MREQGSSTETRGHLLETAPRRVTSSIRRFLATLNVPAPPSFLTFTHVSADYKPGYCLNNCEAESQRSGDPVVFGWVIWEARSHSFIEAEFHAVIRHRGELVDITPRRDGEITVLFVPDYARDAIRVDERTWRTWNNHKSQNGQVIQATAPIDLEELDGNVHA